jgi:methyl-accepting chemotaxis protein
MSASVIHRIAGGYIFLTLCLITVGITGFLNIRTINNKVDNLANESAPASQLASQISENLAAINLRMYQHFNTTDARELSAHEQALEQLVGSYQQKSRLLQEKLEQMASSQEQVVVLDDIGRETPEMFASIRKGMSLYTSSFAGLALINTGRQDLQRLKAGFEQDFTALDNADFSGNERAVYLYTKDTVYQLLAQSIALSLSNDLDEQRTATAGFNQLLAEFSQAGYRNQTTFRENAQLQKLHKKIFDLAWVVSNSSGLIEAKGTYLSTRTTLTKTITDNQNQLEAIRAKYEKLNQAVQASMVDISAQAASAVVTSQSLILLIVSLAIVASATIGYFVVSSIRKPLYAMIERLAVIAQGDLTRSHHHQSEDEFGKLHASASSLNTSLRGMIEGIAQQSEKILHTANDANQRTQSTQQVTHEQKTQADMVAVAMHEMTSTTREIARIADNTFQEMLNAHNFAETSQNQVKANNELNRQLQDEMENTSQVIAQLDNDVNKIREVLAIIGSIAEQTNLLALNAAIEAARAGEQGRGFAVVADEVRTLANRTKTSTGEINANIDSLLRASQGAVRAIRHSQEKTLESAQMAQLVQEQITGIANIINHTKDMNLQIATAAEEQSQTTEEINRNIVAIADYADQTAQHTAANASGVAALHKAAEALDALVNQFKR